MMRHLKTRVWLGALVAVATVQVAFGEVLPVVNASFEEKDAAGKPVGWRLTNRMTVGKNAGHNGSAGLYWESEGPVEKLSSAMQDVTGLRKGDTVRLEALVRRENLEYKGYGAQVTLELLDTNDHWIAALYSGSGEKEKSGEWYVRRASGVLPANFGRARLAIHVGENTSGKFAVDNVSVERIQAKPVQFVVSSAYRNTAVDGKVRFFASLETPPETVGKASAVFVWKNAAGEKVRTPAASVAEDAASVELDVGRFALGTQLVGCGLYVGDRRIGEAAVRFTRVAELPRRRVTIDAHKRCIVDGRPFFPIGVYAYPSLSNLEALTNSPFNTVQHYVMPSKDLLGHFNRLGLKTFAAFDHKLPEDQLRRRIDEIKGNPSVLAWTLGDEYATAKIPHLRKLYETVCELDPDHPAYLVQDRIYDLRGFLPTTDVIGLDPYPVPEKPLRTVTDFMRGGRKAFFDIAANWSVPQTFSWEWYSRPKDRFPTEGELRSMLWQHIAAGANGIVSFRMHDVKSATWQIVLKTHREIADRVDVLLSVEDCPAAVSSDEALSCRAWAKDGALYVLACNILETPLEADVSLSKGCWQAVSSDFGPMPELSDGRVLRFKMPPAGVSFVRLRNSAAR